jgi:peptidoglycan L-alanyl-D-glutamate endopeptidase CwlK
MPKFSKRSKDNLSQCHIDLQTLFNEVIQIVDCSVLCGYRGAKEQNEAFNKGFSKLKYPKSYHNKIPAMAADVVPYPISWTDTKRFNDFGAYVLKVAMSLYKDGKITHRVEWGGTWEWKDLPHYQIR